mgnify:CR=1 FL=1
MLTTHSPSIASKQKKREYKSKAILAVLAIEAVFVGGFLLYYFL